MAVLAIFRIRRDTAANWTATNPVLALGEPGLETDTRRVKYGDGVTAWTGLAYSAAGAVAWADITGKPTLGTASGKNVGTSGDTVPVADGAAVTWANGATFGGPVGIGTAPSNPLHVHGTSGLTAIRLSDATNGLLGFPGASASGVMTGAAANALAIRAENGLEFSGGGNARHLSITTGGEIRMGGTNAIITATRHPVLRSYTVATLPTVTPAGQLIYVSNGTANKRLAVSDGTNWRFPDGAIVS